MKARSLFTKLCASASLMLLISGMAQADPMITDWNYGLTSDFITGSTVFTSANGTKTNTPTLIAWGAGSGAPGSGRSGIGIVNSAIVGPVTTNGGYVSTGSVFTHYNNVVDSSFGTLKSAAVSMMLTLTPTNPAGPTFGPIDLPFTINFDETPNTTPCVAPSPVNNPCNDIFALTGNLNNSFVLDGNTYFVSFVDATNLLNPLTTAECNDVGLAGPCLGFTTEENKTNSLAFNMLITSEVVGINHLPEPNEIFLIGVALIMLGGFSRRYARK